MNQIQTSVRAYIGKKSHHRWISLMKVYGILENNIILNNSITNNFLDAQSINF